MAIYLRALLASLSIRASDFVVLKIWHLRGVLFRRFVEAERLWQNKGGVAGILTAELPSWFVKAI